MRLTVMTILKKAREIPGLVRIYGSYLPLQAGLVAAASAAGALFTPAPAVPAGHFSLVPAADVPDMPAPPPEAFAPDVLFVVVLSIFIAGAVAPGVWV